MKIGIIGALEAEVGHLKDVMRHARVSTVSGMEFCEGTLHGTDVVVVMCGIGKVNAALCAQTLIVRYGVTHVVNTGVAGSLDARIDIGDVVISTDAVHHDMDARGLGDELGQVPNLDVFSFTADETLRAWAVEAVHATAPDVHAYAGRVASGDQFVIDPAAKEHIVSTFGALCCEMEGAAIAQACTLAHVPFVIVRTISDKADGSATMDYPVFKVQAAKECAGIVEQLVLRAHA